MESAVQMCKQSNSALGLDYIDLFLIHAPTATKGSYLEAWKGLEKCVNMGIVKSIGVSNFNSRQLAKVIANSSIKPVVNQVECNTNINQLKLIQFCKEYNVVLTAHTPLGSPSNSGSIKSHLQNPEVINIGKKYGKTAAQVMLRFLVRAR